MELVKAKHSLEKSQKVTVLYNTEYLRAKAAFSQLHGVSLLLTQILLAYKCPIMIKYNLYLLEFTWKLIIISSNIFWKGKSC